MLCKVILFLTQYGISIRYCSEEIKILANNIAEKIKRDSDADIFNIRYMEKHQSENTNMKEINSIIFCVR